jgi:hypothetical protein
MNGLGRRSALIGLGVSLTGCVASGPIAVTQSNVDAAYGKKLKRVVVAISVHSAKLTKEQNLTLLQVGELKQSFDTKWGALGISVDVIDVDGFGDKARVIGDAVARFGAEQWLALESEWILKEIQAVKAYGIAASLYDVATGKRIWRATTQLPDFWRSSGHDLVIKLGRQNAADHYVDSLTQKLRADGLL